MDQPRDKSKKRATIAAAAAVKALPAMTPERYTALSNPPSSEGAHNHAPH